MSTKKIGDAGENQAAEYLQSKGYEVIDRNYRTRFGEIDIIAKFQNTIVFIEVKAKANEKYGSPGEMITNKKLIKLKNTALNYIKEQEFQGIWRIDAVLILNNKIEHLENITL